MFRSPRILAGICVVFVIVIGVLYLVLPRQAAVVPTASLCMEVADSIPERLVISPDGAKAYITDSVAPRVLVFSFETHSIATSIPLSGPASGVIVSRDGKTAYVATRGNAGKVTVVNTSNDEVLKTIAIDVTKPASLALSPDDERLYVTALDSPRILVLDLATERTVATISTSGNVGAYSQRIVSAPTGANMYATLSDQGGESILVIDSTTNVVVEKIPLERKSFSDGIAVSQDGTAIFVATLGKPGSVAIVDVLAHAISQQVEVGTMPQDVVVSRDGRSVYASNHFDLPGTVSVVDLNTHKVVATIDVGDIPGAMAVSPVDGSIVVLTALREANLVEIDSQTNTVKSRSLILTSEATRAAAECGFTERFQGHP